MDGAGCLFVLLGLFALAVLYLVHLRRHLDRNRQAFLEASRRLHLQLGADRNSLKGKLHGYEINIARAWEATLGDGGREGANERVTKWSLVAEHEFPSGFTIVQATRPMFGAGPKSGDEEFDAVFQISAESSEAAAAYVPQPEARQAMLAARRPEQQLAVTASDEGTFEAKITTSSDSLTADELCRNANALVAIVDGLVAHESSPRGSASDSQQSEPTAPNRAATIVGWLLVLASFLIALQVGRLMVSDGPSAGRVLGLVVSAALGLGLTQTMLSAPTSRAISRAVSEPVDESQQESEHPRDEHALAAEPIENSDRLGVFIVEEDDFPRLGTVFSSSWTVVRKALDPLRRAHIIAALGAVVGAHVLGKIIFTFSEAKGPGWLSLIAYAALGLALMRGHMPMLRTAGVLGIAILAVSALGALSQGYWGASGLAGGAVVLITYTFLAYLRVARAQAAALDDVDPLRLLQLWVFGTNRRIALIDELMWNGWRFFGSRMMFRGPGAAGASWQEQWAFLTGRLRKVIVEDEGDLELALEKLSSQRDIWFRYAADSIQCGAQIWQTALKRVLDDADVVLMDLAGFSKDNAGCVYELGQLLNRKALDRIALVIDRTTDTDYLTECLQKSWAGRALDSPNRDRDLSCLPLYRINGSGKVTRAAFHSAPSITSEQLASVLCEAGKFESPRRETTSN